LYHFAATSPSLPNSSTYAKNIRADNTNRLPLPTKNYKRVSSSTVDHLSTQTGQRATTFNYDPETNPCFRNVPINATKNPLVLARLNSSATTQASRVRKLVGNKRLASVSAQRRLLLENDRAVGQEARTAVCLLLGHGEATAAEGAGPVRDRVDHQGEAGGHAERLGGLVCRGGGERGEAYEADAGL
jgi:hypothetical protein